MMQLARLTSALAVVGNAWFVVLWSRAESHIPYPLPPALSGPVWQPLLAATLVAIGLYAFGAALNDILDLRRDRLLHAHRPLAGGSLGLESAVWIVVVTCGLSILGATWFGDHAILLTLLLQLGILSFHAAARFVPGVGLVILGAIHAGHMLVPNLHLGFFWPVWMIFVHATSVAAIAHVIGRKVPKLSRRAILAVILGLASMTFLALRWPHAHGQVPLSAWIAPGVLAGIFALWIVHLIRKHGPGSRVAEKITRYGALWMPLYGTSWLLGTDRVSEAFVLGALTLIASLGVAIAREAYGLLTEPIGFRR
jgi:4-hydroxybenzoate polyprenyltransferase